MGCPPVSRDQVSEVDLETPQPRLCTAGELSLTAKQPERLPLFDATIQAPVAVAQEKMKMQPPRAMQRRQPP